jgi:hypothetical protein
MGCGLIDVRHALLTTEFRVAEDFRDVPIADTSGYRAWVFVTSFVFKNVSEGFAFFVIAAV